MVVVALELSIHDRGLPWSLRFLCGYCLLKVWACLRYDDARGLNPSRIVRRGDGLELVPDRTKTSGGSKEEQRAHVHFDCTL